MRRAMILLVAMTSTTMAAPPTSRPGPPQGAAGASQASRLHAAPSVRPGAQLGGGRAVEAARAQGLVARDAARSRAWRRPEQAGKRGGIGHERSELAGQAADRHPLERQLLRPDPRGADVRHRLAQIDRIRDEALVTGNSRLLDRADRLEAEAHAGGRFTPGYGRLTAAQARGEEVVPPPDGVYGPGYGLLTAEEARSLGRDFGQRTAEAARARQEAEFEDGASSAEVDSGFGPGYGRLAARQRLHPSEEPAQAMESADGQFLPGYGRLTAAQARGEEVVLPPDGVYGPGYGRLTASERHDLEGHLPGTYPLADDQAHFEAESEAVAE